MAADDRLLKRQEIIGNDTDNMLAPYRHFESFDGVKMFFDTFSLVYYSDTIRNLYSVYTEAYYTGTTSDSDGIELEEYYPLGSGTEATLKKNQLVPLHNYVDQTQLYFITIEHPGRLPASMSQPQFPGKGIYPNNCCNYKCKFWFGHSEAYYGDDYSNSSTNPFMNMSSWSTMKTGLNQSMSSNVYNCFDSYAFTEVYIRYSKTYIQNLFDWGTNSNANSYFQWAFKTCFVREGSKFIALAPAYKGDGYTTRNYNPNRYNADAIHFMVPTHDGASPGNYLVYGIVATQWRLNNDSYISLMGYNHTTKLMLNYLGDDNDFYNSSGQSTNSKSGFLNFSSGAQDRVNGLRYIYTTKTYLSRGFANNVNDCLILWGLVNAEKKGTFNTSVSFSPLDNSSYTFRVQFAYEIYDESDTLLNSGTFDSGEITCQQTLGYSNTLSTVTTQNVDRYCYAKIGTVTVYYIRQGYGQTTFTRAPSVATAFFDGNGNVYGLVTFDPPQIVSYYLNVS